LPRSFSLFLLGQGRALPILSYFRNITTFKYISAHFFTLTLPRSFSLFLLGQGRALPILSYFRNIKKERLLPQSLTDWRFRIFFCDCKGKYVSPLFKVFPSIFANCRSISCCRSLPHAYPILFTEKTRGCCPMIRRKEGPLPIG